MVGYTKINVYEETKRRIGELQLEWELSSQNAVIERLIEIAEAQYERRQNKDN